MVREALQLLAASDATMGHYIVDYSAVPTSSVPYGWTANHTNGTSTRVTGVDGALVKFNTSTTNNSVAGHYMESVLVSNLKTKKWLYEARFKIVTTPDPTTKVINGLYGFGGGNGITIGSYGPSNTTNFVVGTEAVYTAPTTVTSTGVALDTALHTFRLYGRGDNNLYYRVDGGAEGVIALTAACLDATLVVDVRNGNVSAAQEMQIDYVGIVFPRA